MRLGLAVETPGAPRSMSVLAIWRALDGIRFNSGRQADPGRGRMWVQNYFDEQDAEIAEQRAIFDAARKAFVIAAHLPPKTLEEARNQPGRCEQIEQITKRVKSEGIKYVVV
jgi:hypothetical protein